MRHAFVAITRDHAGLKPASWRRIGIGIGMGIGFALLACSPAKDESGAKDASPAPVSSARDSGRTTSPTLWRVESVAGPATGSMTLLGSIHVGPEGGWILPERARERFEAADALVVEVDAEGETDEQHDDLTLSFGLLPIGTTVREKISPALYDALRAHLRKTGQTIMGLDQLEPWMIAIALASGELERLGYSPANGVDVTLLASARAEGKDVIALESTHDQLEMLDALSEPLQELMLKDALLQAAETERTFRDISGAWRRGDQAALDDALFRGLEKNPELAPFYERVIFDRNITMLTDLERLLASDRDHFVVVGAAHLAGERGIPARLAERGYRVERIETAASD